MINGRLGDQAYPGPALHSLQQQKQQQQQQQQQQQSLPSSRPAFVLWAVTGASCVALRAWSPALFYAVPCSAVWWR
jgi:hypothetical protein